MSVRGDKYNRCKGCIYFCKNAICQIKGKHFSTIKQCDLSKKEIKKKII